MIFPSSILNFHDWLRMVKPYWFIPRFHKPCYLIEPVPLLNLSDFDNS